jgi:hydroxymethylbilane synthase
MNVVLGTRGSALALWQARHVADLLRRRRSGLAVTERIVKTLGDTKADGPIEQAGERGVFVRRLEQALLEREIDLAVHSMKDMPTDQPQGLAVGAVLERHDPRDVLISARGWSLADLPRGAVVGTGSPRRRSQLLHARPDLDVRPIRGNVDTRIAKLGAGEFDAVVLALAGVERLGIGGVSLWPLEPGQCLPAAAQGALAVEIRSDDARAAECVAALHHAPSATAVAAERAFLRRLGGGCLAPATAFARVEADRVRVEALVAHPEGRTVLIERETGPAGEAEAVGARLAERLLVAGAGELLALARAAPGDGNGGR